jgi:hypothetical protein
MRGAARNAAAPLRRIPFFPVVGDRGGGDLSTANGTTTPGLVRAGGDLSTANGITTPDFVVVVPPPPPPRGDENENDDDDGSGEEGRGEWSVI